MELCIGYDKQQKRDGRCQGELDAGVRGSRGSVPRRMDDEHVSAAGPDGLVSTERRYERFEPITVRAAARVLQLQRAGIVSAGEARFYIRELASMDAHAGPGAFSCLARAAQRHLSVRPIARTKAREGAVPGYPTCLNAPRAAGVELRVLA